MIYVKDLDRYQILAIDITGIVSQYHREIHCHRNTYYL